MNQNHKYLRFVYLGLFALLGLFVGGRWAFPLAAWLAPIFAIRFYRDSEKGGRSLLWLWLASAVPGIIAWHNATAMSFLGPLVEPIFFSVMGLITMIPFIIDRIYYRRWAQNGRSPFWLTLVYPLSVTAVDFFSASGSPFGSFGAGAYSQVGATALMQVTALAGIWIIPFIVGWFACVINYTWENGFQWSKINRGVLSYAGLMILILGFGIGRLALAAPVQQDVQVGGFSLPEEGLGSMIVLWQDGDEAAFRERVSELHTRQLAQVRLMAQEGAQIVVLQEAAGMGFAEEVDVFLANAASLAQEEGIYLVLPTAMMDPNGIEPHHNVVRIIDPNGEVVLKHYKYGGNQFEGSVAGSGELQFVQTPFGKLSAVICWDADFPAIIKQAGEQNVDLLFVPANDWLEVRDIHAGMATFRAVENGMSIFRQTGAGVSIVADAYGRVINRVDVYEQENNAEWGGEQMVMTPVGSVATLYPAIGDAFGSATMLALLFLVGFAVLKRKKSG